MKYSPISRYSALIVSTLIVATSASAGKPATGKSQPQSDTPVSVTISDAQYYVQSDGAGSYQNGVSGVSSVLQATLGDWAFDEYSSTTRKIFVSLNDPVNQGTFNPFGAAGSGVVPGHIMAKTSEYLSGSLPSMTLGQQTFSQLSVGFRIYSDSRHYKQYRLDNNPMMHSGSDAALITCTGAGTNGLCNAWHIQTSGIYGGAQKNIAYFEDVTNMNSPIFIGYYYTTFDIQLQK